jgi:hypothetical protein
MQAPPELQASGYSSPVSRSFVCTFSVFRREALGSRRQFRISDWKLDVAQLNGSRHRESRVKRQRELGQKNFGDRSHDVAHPNLRALVRRFGESEDPLWKRFSFRISDLWIAATWSARVGSNRPRIPALICSRSHFKYCSFSCSSSFGLRRMTTPGISGMS